MSDKSSSIEAQLKQLESIVASFEDGEISIDAAIAQFEKGAELAEKIKERLGVLENKITVLKDRFDEPA